MDNKVDVIIKGLTEEEAKEFLNWYSGQGEEDAGIWFEVVKNHKYNVRDWIPTDDAKTFPAVKLIGNDVVTNEVYVLYIKDDE